MISLLRLILFFGSDVMWKQALADVSDEHHSIFGADVFNTYESIFYDPFTVRHRSASGGSPVTAVKLKAQTSTVKAAGSLCRILQKKNLKEIYIFLKNISMPKFLGSYIIWSYFR